MWASQFRLLRETGTSQMEENYHIGNSRSIHYKIPFLSQSLPGTSGENILREIEERRKKIVMKNSSSNNNNNNNNNNKNKYGRCHRNFVLTRTKLVVSGKNIGFDSAPKFSSIAASIFADFSKVFLYRFSPHANNSVPSLTIVFPICLVSSFMTRFLETIPLSHDVPNFCGYKFGSN